MTPMKTELKPTVTFSKDDVIVTDDEIFQIDIFPGISDDVEFKEGYAYVDNNVFYIYRGKPKHRISQTTKPGIYDNPDKTPKYILIPPTTEEELRDYDATEHISRLSTVSIIDTANTKEDLLIAIPESTKIFQPMLMTSDDILKRVLKKILIEKNVDLDRYKERFKNKNELFNLKQVIRGNNKVSILIFDRGCEALNLKYTITVEERTTNDVVGNALIEPIVVSSEDAYEI